MEGSLGLGTVNNQRKKVLGKSQDYEVRKFLRHSRNNQVIEVKSEESQKNVLQP